MQTITFDQLPQAVSQLYDKLSNIEELLKEAKIPETKQDELLTISEAAKFLKLSIPTIYGKVSRQEIPVNKQGKRLYFYKAELADWIKQGRKKTITEIRQEAEETIISKKRNSHS